MGMPYVGRSLPRRGDERLVRGNGRFVADLSLPGVVHAAVLRSPHAHARILSINAAAARAQDGVLAVLTAADLPPGLPPIPLRTPARVDHELARQHPLAIDRVRYVGEPVAVVVARTPYLAEAVLDGVEVVYEPLPAVTDPAAALAPEAPRLHPALGTNLVARFTQSVGDVAAALANADLVVEEEFSVQRHAAVPMETRGLLAEYHPRDGRLTVWGPTKVIHFNRRLLAELLGLPEHRLRFVEPDVGGGFGARGEFYPEDFLIPYLALRLRRPVRWVEDRREHLMAANHSREHTYRMRAAVRRDGTVLGLEARICCNQGAYLRTHGVLVPDIGSALLLGPYRVANYRADVEVVLTNKTPMGTYRGPGRYEGTFARERLMDVIAARLGLDPAELRRRNLIRPGELPYHVGTGGIGTPTIYDSGDYPALLDDALRLIDYDGWRREQVRLREQGRCVGVGIGCFVEKAGLGPWEYARVAVDASGSIVVYSGAANLGQGTDTALTQVVADALAVTPEQVHVVSGDTDRVPYGMGSWASRGAVMAGNAAYLAACRLRERAFAVAAETFEVAEGDLELREGAIRVRGVPGRALTWADLARISGPVPGRPLRPPGAASGHPPEPTGLDVTHFFEVEHMTYPAGVHAAVVEVDPETGLVRILRYAIAYDVGRSLNPRLVEGQLVGGLAQGVGGALLEELAYGEDGQLLSGTFIDYLLPAATDVPAEVRISLHEVPSPLNPLGVKGAGEGGCTGASGAIANAVADALAPFGARVRSLPLTPPAVRRLASAAAPVPAEDRGDRA